MSTAATAVCLATPIAIAVVGAYWPDLQAWLMRRRLRNSRKGNRR